MGQIEQENSYGPFRLEVTGKLVPKSGFRIGSADSLSLYTDLPVLRWEAGRNGRPYIPGSSLRGVLRAHLERENWLLGFADKQVLLSLFGYAPKDAHAKTPSSRGRLRVMDSLLESASPSSTEIRDHVRIDPDTGAASELAKFDAEHVVKAQNQSFPLHLIYEGESKDDAELVLLGEAVRALVDEELAIGSRASIGFGRFKLDSVQFKVFNRVTPEGLRSFLADRLDSQSRLAEHADSFVFPKSTDAPIHSANRDNLHPLHRLMFELSIPCNGPMLVKEGAPPQAIAKDLVATGTPGATFLTTLDAPDHGQVGAYPLIPGASIRGVLRHRAEKICTAQRLGSGPALWLFGSKKDEGVDTERRGLVQFDDCILSGMAEAVSSDHVAVDRITHAAADGAKFDDRALNGPLLTVIIRTQFTDDSEDRVAIALLLFLIKDLLADGSGIAFGSQTSRGYGSLYRAKLTRLSGSLHGVRPKAKNDKEICPGRWVFEFCEKATETPWKQLCANFDSDWKSAPRAVRHD